jgi:hypothetical protein
VAFLPSQALAGGSVTHVAVSASDTFPVGDGKVFLHIRNSGGSTDTVTLVSTVEVGPGLSVADLTITVPAGADRFVGPVNPALFAEDGVVTVQHSATSGVVCAVIDAGGFLTTSESAPPGELTASAAVAITAALAAAGVVTKSVAASRSTTATVTATVAATRAAAATRSTTATITATADVSTPGDITHGIDLTMADVGPWKLQGVAQGSESLQSVSTPGRGYFRIDTPSEFAPTGTYVYNNSTSNYGGIVPAGGLTIDGYFVEAGTVVAQFRSYAAPDFYGGGNKVLFRGCRFSTTAWPDGTGMFNDSTAASGWKASLHYCELTNPDGHESVHQGPLAKHLAGSGHRYYRNLARYTATFFQPNVSGCEFVENYLSDMVYPFGESGPAGDPLHCNGISIEGGLAELKILRNRIFMPSLDGCTGTKGTASNQGGYGTQSGQSGYGSGTLGSGRLITQTDCIALFTSSGTQWTQGSAGGVQVKDNYLHGAGFALYVEGTPSNVEVSGNKFSTMYWTNGANYGANSFGTFTNGSNGNIVTNNTWSDDYGTGGNGVTATANRQYPAGNGPRAGTLAFGA